MNGDVKFFFSLCYREVLKLCLRWTSFLFVWLCSLVSGLLLVVVHSGEKLLAMDDDGYSDPYCIVTANKEKVPHISGTDNPSNLNNLFKTNVFEFCLTSSEALLIQACRINAFCFQPLKCRTESKNRDLANTFFDASCMYLPLQPNLFSLTNQVWFLWLTFIRKLF